MNLWIIMFASKNFDTLFSQIIIYCRLFFSLYNIDLMTYLYKAIIILEYCNIHAIFEREENRLLYFINSNYLIKIDEKNFG